MKREARGPLAARLVSLRGSSTPSPPLLFPPLLRARRGSRIGRPVGGSICTRWQIPCVACDATELRRAPPASQSETRALRSVTLLSDPVKRDRGPRLRDEQEDRHLED